MGSSNLVRPLIQKLHAYVPGEQPKIKGLIKLNTNENPYPPAPKVLAAIRKAADGRLRLYPNPTAENLRKALAKLHKCDPENIIVGNGSDELLALATRVFVDPGGIIQYFTPSYSLYPVLADIAGARKNPVPLRPDFDISLDGWNTKAPLSFVTTPNAPSGRSYSSAKLKRICKQQNGVVILDEAYVDFAEGNALPIGLSLKNVLVSRTFSKAYSLCFLRVGYFVGNPDLIDALDKARDSYNVNGLGQIAAEETLNNLNYYKENFKKIKSSRELLTSDLSLLGFKVLPSATNFVLTRPPRFPASEWVEKLRSKKILVRWFNYPETRQYIRITIGSAQEMAVLVRAAKQIIKC